VLSNFLLGFTGGKHYECLPVILAQIHKEPYSLLREKIIQFLSHDSTGAMTGRQIVANIVVISNLGFGTHFVIAVDSSLLFCEASIS